MAPYTLHLFATRPATISSVIEALRHQEPPPLTIGRAYNWLGPSTLLSALSERSGFNVVSILPGFSLAAPPGLQDLLTSHWSLLVELNDDFAEDYAGRNKTFLEDKSFDASGFPETSISDSEDDQDLEFPLTPERRKFISSFSKSHPGPVTMLNLLAFHEGKRERYMKYIENFTPVLGPRHGPKPKLLGEVVKGTNQKQDNKESNGDTPFEIIAFVHYPDVANFGRMLEDEEYKKLDREWKKGVVMDNPLLCMVEIAL